MLPSLLNITQNTDSVIGLGIFGSEQKQFVGKTVSTLTIFFGKTDIGKLFEYVLRLWLGRHCFFSTMRVCLCTGTFA